MESGGLANHKYDRWPQVTEKHSDRGIPLIKLQNLCQHDGNHEHHQVHSPQNNLTVSTSSVEKIGIKAI
jgi:hypothetical protein